MQSARDNHVLACNFAKYSPRSSYLNVALCIICVMLAGVLWQSAADYECSMFVTCTSMCACVRVCVEVTTVQDHGLMVGSWSGRYRDGTAPPLWTGSLPILRQFVESRCQPVKYGQCWVFAALAATRQYHPLDPHTHTHTHV